MRLGEDDRWRVVGVLSARIWLDQSRAASGCAYAYVSITAAEKIVLRGLDVCVCHHSHGSNQSDPSGLDKSRC